MREARVEKETERKWERYLGLGLASILLLGVVVASVLHFIGVI